jgi:hypothetical protein
MPSYTEAVVFMNRSRPLCYFSTVAKVRGLVTNLCVDGSKFLHDRAFRRDAIPRFRGLSSSSGIARQHKNRAKGLEFSRPHRLTAAPTEEDSLDAAFPLFPAHSS